MIKYLQNAMRFPEKGRGQHQREFCAVPCKTSPFMLPVGLCTGWWAI